MGKLSFSDAKHIQNTLIRDRAPYLSQWGNRSKVMSPRRFNLNPGVQSNSGSRKDQEIINNQVRLSLRTFVSGLMNGSTPRARPWFKMVALNESAGNTKASKIWFAQVERIILAHMQIGNLYRVLPMAYKDVGIFDNAAYAILPHERFGAHYTPFAVGSFAFSSDSEGNTTTFMREFSLSIRQTVEVYGSTDESGQIDWTNFDPWIKSAWNEARYNDRVQLVNLIVPNPEPKENPFFAHERAYQSYTWVEGSGSNTPGQMPNGTRQTNGGSSIANDGKGFISVKGWDYFPVITPRWEVAPEQDYGDEGPGCLALGDANMLQELEKARLESVDKLIRPPMIGPASLRRVQASILAGGITYLDEVDGTKQFRPAFTVDPKISALLDAKRDVQEQIKSAFFEDLFLMLANERAVSHVTAREIEERSAEKLSALGPVLGQLDQDQNRRLVETNFRILAAQGKLPPKPKELQGIEIRPEYISILAQAQKASQIVAIEKAVAFTGQMAEAMQDPSILQLVQSEFIVRQYFDFMGVDPAAVKGELEFEKIKQAAQQAQAQQQAQQVQAQAAQTAKDMSQAKLGEGSVLDAVGQQQQAV